MPSRAMVPMVTSAICVRRSTPPLYGCRVHYSCRGGGVMTERTAVIAGGGIGGLAAAAGLHPRGWTVRVLERGPEVTEGGAGVSLWAKAFTALATLGGGAPGGGRVRGGGGGGGRGGGGRCGGGGGGGGRGGCGTGGAGGSCAWTTGPSPPATRARPWSRTAPSCWRRCSTGCRRSVACPARRCAGSGSPGGARS